MKRTVVLAGQWVHLKAKPEKDLPRQRVWLLEHAMIEEGANPGAITTCVMVLKRASRHDDGIREVSLDQIEEAMF